MKPIRWKQLLLCLLIPEAVGGLAGWLTSDAAALSETLHKPPLAPPAWAFPIAWAILYALMGISSYLILQGEGPKVKPALAIYGAQLAVNFLWPLVFFLGQAYLLAFFILVLLYGLVLWMIRAFRPIRPAAANLQLPYVLWLTYAAYLNLGVYLLNP